MFLFVSHYKLTANSSSPLGTAGAPPFDASTKWASQATPTRRFGHAEPELVDVASLLANDKLIFELNTLMAAGHFQFQDVPADGTCLYRCLADIWGHPLYRDAESMRAFLLSKLLHDPKVVDMMAWYYRQSAADDGGDTWDSFLGELRTRLSPEASGTRMYGGVEDIMVFSYCSGMRVMICQDTSKESFSLQDISVTVERAMEAAQRSPDVPDNYLVLPDGTTKFPAKFDLVFHHLAGNPTDPRPSDKNHFAALRPIDGEKIDKCPIYLGSGKWRHFPGSAPTVTRGKHVTNSSRKKRAHSGEEHTIKVGRPRVSSHGKF